MEFPVRNVAGFSVIELHGEIDLQVSPRAREQIIDHLQRQRDVLVDLSAVKYIDSSGVASLVSGLRVARDNELRFGLLNVSTPVMQVLKLTRLDGVFRIHASVEEAGR